MINFLLLFKFTIYVHFICCADIYLFSFFCCCFLFIFICFIICQIKLSDIGIGYLFWHVNSGSPTTVTSNGANLTILPNKSTLYGNSNNVNTNTITVKMTTTPTITTTNKVVPNHGKPNFAPKPPGIQNIVTAKNNGLNATNNINSTTNNGNSTRPIVSRAHSMRSPRFVNAVISLSLSLHILSINYTIASLIASTQIIKD